VGTSSDGGGGPSSTTVVIVIVIVALLFAGTVVAYMHQVEKKKNKTLTGPTDGQVQKMANFNPLFTDPPPLMTPQHQRASTSPTSPPRTPRSPAHYETMFEAQQRASYEIDELAAHRRTSKMMIEDNEGFGFDI
jgi:hypothetical protein